MRAVHQSFARSAHLATGVTRREPKRYVVPALAGWPLRIGEQIQEDRLKPGQQAVVSARCARAGVWGSWQPRKAGLIAIALWALFPLMASAATFRATFDRNTIPAG